MNTVAYWMIVAGLIGGFIAALFGWIDWFGIPQGTRAKRKRASQCSELVGRPTHTRKLNRDNSLKNEVEANVIR